jgi:hypothetical protein
MVTKSKKQKADTILNTNDPAFVKDWITCFNNNLDPLDAIIRNAIPTKADGIHKIKDPKIQTQLLTELSQAKFLKNFWYKYAHGDFYVQKLSKLPSGNWLISIFNWEIKFSEIWVCKYPELQYEFILIKSVKQKPYRIKSDTGGTSYKVGILKDGTVVSEQEKLNGYAFINGKKIDLYEHGIESRRRDKELHWVFLVSEYHKAGYNTEETMNFCEKLDCGEIEVNEKNIFKFLNEIKNNPIINI